MHTLLFEIGTEELPSWYLPQAKEALAEGLALSLREAQLDAGSLRAYATPRRLAVTVSGLAGSSHERVEKRRGPAKAAAFDDGGRLSRAALGFARANGVKASELTLEETDRGAYLFASKRSGGEPAVALLPGLLKALVEGLPAPRKMRWSDVETSFLRPISWILALLDDRVLAVSVAGLEAGITTRGHRFLSPGAIKVAHPDGYLKALEQAHVIADLERRQEKTLEAAQGAAATKGLEAVTDPRLLAEVSNLVEWPVGVLGGFEAGYLELPEEVLVTTMTHHQRYFPTHRRGKLAPYFVSIANNEVKDESLIRKGYEGVLAGRLADARFFYDADRRKSLRRHAQGLAGIGFHKGLGSMADKTARSGKLAREIAGLAGLTARELETLEGAIPIFRADLSTQMVYELPELEGVMARAYAVAEGYPEEVAYALEEAVLPKGPEAPLPGSRVGAVLSVADRLDKLVGFFSLGRKPSGSADPFGLRRDAVAVARVLNHQGWPVTLATLVAAAAGVYRDQKVEAGPKSQAEVVAFIWERVAGLLAEEGVGTVVMRAARADQPAVITASRRCHLLCALSAHAEFRELLTLYKRAANLASKAGDAKLDPELFETPYETPLYDALGGAQRGIDGLIERAEEALRPWDLGRGPEGDLGNLEADLASVLTLKAPLDAFLDNVLVMVEDARTRSNRLALLAGVRDALSGLGALEELEGV